METLIKDKVKDIQPFLIKKIQELVSIESVKESPETCAPYGKNIKKALMFVLELADELGFKTVNLNDRIAYAQYGDDCKNGYYGVFGHVDVVALGEGWRHHPLGGEIKDDCMYGRGVLDNKGPILSNLLALYILKELGINFPYPVRIVFGCDEESGFSCVKHYLQIENPPKFGWTPDCKWPVVYGERGRLTAQIINHRQKNEDFYRFINEYFLSSLPNGNKLGIDFEDKDFGQLIMRGYQLFEIEGKNRFQFSISYPNCCTKTMLVDKIASHLPSSLSIKVVNNWNPVIYDKESLYVKEIQKVYCEVTGNDSTPVTTTGGTYAKIIPNIVAFGPSYPGQRDIAHLPDEWINLEDLERNTLIYALALYRLSRIDI